MNRRALTLAAVSLALVACSSPTANETSDVKVQAFGGTIEISSQGGVDSFYDRNARFTLKRAGTIDVAATVSPATDLKFGLHVYFGDGRLAYAVDPATPPTFIGHWDGVPAGTYFVDLGVYPEGKPLGRMIFTVAGTITYKDN